VSKKEFNKAWPHGGDRVSEQEEQGPAREPSVVFQLESLSKTVDDLRGVSKILSERLVLVLNQHPRPETDQRDTKDCSEPCKIADSLKHLNQNVSEVVWLLRDLNERLEI